MSLVRIDSLDAPPVMSVEARLVKLETQIAELSTRVSELVSTVRLLERITIAVAATTGGLQAVSTLLGG